MFGDSAGLNFSGPTPIYIESSISSVEASASISDAFGNLLFYTNGENIWNRNNDIMPNGDSLNIGLVSPNSHSSITQGVVIIPKPGSETIYYLFQIQDIGIEYSTININLDGGLGDVTEKNIPIYSEWVWEKMQVVKHANGRDWWLLLRSSAVGDTTFFFIRFLITPDFITEPYFQYYGPGYDGPPGSGNSGQMKFSQSGNTLVLTRHSYIDIYDFDRCSGIASNVQSILVQEGDFIYGCEFSDEGRILYLTSVGYELSSAKLYQYCLTCPGSIEDTKQTIYSNVFEDYSLAQLQIGADDKIYVPLSDGVYLDYTYSTVNMNICVINSPNLSGISCNFDTLTIPLGPSRCIFSLPNMPNYNLGPLTGSDCDTLGLSINTTIKQNTLTIYPNPASNYIYISGDLALENGNLNLELYNILGQKVFEQKNIKLNTRIELPLNNTGIFEVVVKKDDMAIHSEKLIIAF